MRLALTTFCVILFMSFSTATTAQDSTYVPTSTLEEGKQLIAVYFGATHCGPCHFPEVKKAIQRMKPLLRSNAKAIGYSFSVTGAALDWKVKNGYEFLEENGPFDEIVVGKNWSNLAVVDYLWADSTSLPAIPQIVLIEREMTMTESRSTYSPNIILARYVGAETLSDWVDAGAPLCWAKEEYGPLTWVSPDCMER